MTGTQTGGATAEASSEDISRMVILFRRFVFATCNTIVMILLLLGFVQAKLNWALNTGHPFVIVGINLAILATAFHLLVVGTKILNKKAA